MYVKPEWCSRHAQRNSDRQWDKGEAAQTESHQVGTENSNKKQKKLFEEMQQETDEHNMTGERINVEKKDVESSLSFLMLVCHTLPSFVCSSHAAFLCGSCVHVRANYRMMPPVARSVVRGRSCISAMRFPPYWVARFVNVLITLLMLAAMPHLLRVLE